MQAPGSRGPFSTPTLTSVAWLQGSAASASEPGPEQEGMARIALVLFMLASGAGAEEPRVIAPGSSEILPFPGHSVALLAGPRATRGGAAVLELVVPARTFGAPPHIHTREDEFFYVLEGSVHFLERGNTVTAGPGSLVVLPRGHLHGFWNASEQTARLLLVVTPGEFASFFDDVVARLRKSHPSDAASAGAILSAAAAERGVEIYPDKVPASARHLLPR